jgi:uroporphyrin-3 C-methyltransferase
MARISQQEPAMNPDSPNASPGAAKPPVDILARPPAKPARVARTALWVLGISFVMGLIALLGALYLDKSFERKIARIELRTDEIRREIQDGLRPALRSVTERGDGLTAAGAQLTERVSKMDEQLGQTTAAQGQLSAMIQGGRRTWILYEVEYLLLNANDRLMLEADVAGALRALEAASQRLGVAADPQLLPVRARIAQELAELRAIPQPDVEDIALTLSTLGAGVPRMPLASSVPENFSAAAEKSAPAAAQGRWERFLQMMARALRGLAIIRRENKPLEPLLPPDAAFFLYQNLQLKLENARLSALHRDTAGFRASVAGARGWLEAYFATGDPQVAATIKVLSTLEREQLAWTLPDVTGSLSLLRREMEARGVKPTQAAPVPRPAAPENPGTAAPAP